MELTEEMKADIRHWAGLGLLPENIADIMNLPVDDFVKEAKDKKSELNKTIRQGITVQEAQLREAIFKSALQGSSPAQNLAKQYLSKANIRHVFNT